MPKTSFIKQNWQWFTAILLGTFGNILLLGITFGSLTSEMRQQRKDIDDTIADVKIDRRDIIDLKVATGEIRTDVKWLRQQEENRLKNTSAHARGN